MTLAMLLDLRPYTEPLSRAPGILRAVIEGQPDEWLDRRHDPEVLSPRETVAHLVLCEQESWVQRVQRIMNPELGFPKMEVSEEELLARQSLSSLLDEFASVRAKCLRDLEALELSESDLDRLAEHPRLGPVTVRQLLSTWVAHDLYHLGQIFKSYSAPFKDEIGPYQKFLNLPQFN